MKPVPKSAAWFTVVRIAVGSQEVATRLVAPESRPVDELEPLCAMALRKFVRTYSAKNGWAPTIQEIADAVGLVSPNSTRQHLHKLVENGFIHMEPRQARAIALIDPAPDGWTRKA